MMLALSEAVVSFVISNCELCHHDVMGPPWLVMQESNNSKVACSGVAELGERENDDEMTSLIR